MSKTKISFKITRAIFYLFLVLFNYSFLLANTYVSGTISVNTIWTAGNSPYIVNGNITLNSGVKLDIEPGAVIKFGAGMQLNINGKLTAVGTEEEKIIFTSWKDDSAGGDSNGDGSASVPAAGDWDKIYFYGGGAAGSVLENCEVRYGGSDTSWGEVAIDRVGGEGVRIENCEITDSKNYGIREYASVVEILGNRIERAVHGIAAEYGSGEIKGNEIRNNAVWGIIATITGVKIRGNTIIENIAGGIISQGSSGEVKNNDIKNNGVGIYCSNTTSEINFNNIAENTEGVKNVTSDKIVNARYNWWGTADGPSGVGPGSGDSVSDYVDYEPWSDKSHLLYANFAVKEGYFTNQQDITLLLYCIGADEFIVAENPDFTDALWQAFVPEKTFSLSAAEGAHTLCPIHLMLRQWFGDENGAKMANINKILSNCAIQRAEQHSMSAKRQADNLRYHVLSFFRRLKPAATSIKPATTKQENILVANYIGIQNTGKSETGNFYGDEVLRTIITGRDKPCGYEIVQAGHWDLHIDSLMWAVEIVISYIFRDQLFELPEAVNRNSIEKFGFKRKEEPLYFSIEERIARGTA
ncbi:hypothetical protein FP828_09585 [bacterium]|nr:hypothetical protein [bacterium]